MIYHQYLIDNFGRIWKHNFEAILCVIFFLPWVPIFIALCVCQFFWGYGKFFIITWKHFHHLITWLLEHVSLFLVCLIPTELLLLWFLLIHVVSVIIGGICLDAARYGYHFGFMEGMKALVRTDSEQAASASLGLLNKHLYQKDFHVACYFGLGIIGMLVALLARQLTHPFVWFYLLNHFMEIL